MVHADAVIEEGATVVGPAVVGRGARIRQNAVVAQCVVAPGIEVPEGASLRHLVVAGSREGGRVSSGPSATENAFSTLGVGATALPDLHEDRRTSAFPAIKSPPWTECTTGSTTRPALSRPVRWRGISALTARP